MSDDQLDDGGKTHVSHVTIPQQMERRSIDGSFRRFVSVSAPQSHVRNKIIDGLPLLTMFVVTREMIRQ